MSTLTLKATVTQVPFGGIEIEGLLLESGEFAVGVPQISQLFPYFSEKSDPHKHGAQSLKRLMGKDLMTHKVKAFGQNKYALAISLIDFERVLRKLDKLADPVAEQISESLIGLSLTQLFSDAFNIKFEKSDRQEWLKSRLQGKVTRRTLTDAIKEYLLRHPEVSDNARKFIYSNVSDCLNKAIFGKTAKQLCEERNCEKDELRNTHDDKALKRIDSHEEFAMKLIDKLDTEPLDAMKQAVEFYC